MSRWKRNKCTFAARFEKVENGELRMESLELPQRGGERN